MSNDLPTTKEAPEARYTPETSMDAGSQALSEALRSSFGIIKLVVVILFLVFLGSGFFTVGPQERAIILRFGKPVGQGERALLGPGLHWSFPYPMDEVVKVSITGIQKVGSTVGWFAITEQQELAGLEPMFGPSINPAQDGYVLTADGNIVNSRATLNYRINDPVRYVFSFASASNAVQQALDNALLSTAARFKVDDILTRDITAFNEAVRRRVTEQLEKQNLGVIVEQCSVESRPPRQVKEAFNNVLRAEVNRSKVLNDAHSYEVQVLSKASADAQSRVNLAESERVRLVQDVASRAEQFQELLPKFRENPKLFAEQRLNGVLGRVFANVQDKILVPATADGKTMELRYLFNRELPKPKTEEQK